MPGRFHYPSFVTDVHYLLLSAALAWIMIMTAAELHTPTWTRAGARLAFGNRDALPERSALAGRAERAARNMIENLILFIAVFVAARAAGVDARLGAAVFFFARLAYFVAYLAGIRYVRSVIWAVAVLAMAQIGLSAAGVLG
jgi:uncharacterized MAPEG superfamily protein